MRLLILTQAVDKDEPTLGFFHRWIEELAPKFNSIEVICIREGRHALPANVRIHSLGKEKGASRLQGVLRFYRYIWMLRHSYDSVFVHMSQEYAVLGGPVWMLLRKPMYLWRNYHGGSFRTDVAVAFSTKVFCTSTHSYTAGRKKTMLMPVGVDTAQFFPDPRIVRKPDSILFLSGMWPSKRPEMLIEALVLLNHDGVDFSADFYGSPLPVTEAYYASLKQRVIDAGLSSHVAFHPGVPNSETPDLFRAHRVFVNCSPSGMFDKTLFEASACGARVLAASLDLKELAGSEAHFDSVEELKERLRAALTAPPLDSVPAFVQEHSLSLLADRLANEL